MTLDECRNIIKARPKWLKEYQKYCNDVMNNYDGSVHGLGVCGEGYYCEYCRENELDDNGCAKALERYLSEKNKSIDYRNTTHKYFRKLVMGETK